MGLFQSNLPVVRSRHIARNALALSSPELTKTRSSQMTGVAAEGPGSAATHFTSLVLENAVGRLASVVDPLKEGPRHCGQFSARADDARVIATLSVIKSV